MMIVPSLVEAQSVSASSADASVTKYVDPLIGSEGLGRVFIGPSCPFGMVKPGPDCGVSNNAGWSKDGDLSGFSQTHVSGTGGGPKYGNILVKFEGKRESEEVKLGYYSCTLTDGRKAEITTAERAAFYRFSLDNYRELNGELSQERKNLKTQKLKNSLSFDLQHFLGRNPVPKAREAQQYEDSKLNIVNDSVTTGYQTISGGWNNGGPYTVYFYAIQKTLSPTLPRNGEGDRQHSHPDGFTPRPYGRGEGGEGLLLKIGISFVSIDQAKQNLLEDIPHWDFNRTYDECIQKWEAELSKIQLAEDATEQQRRMFYTALYHTMLMPVDRTKDNGFYDDYYAIWDTYRTSSPLLAIINPERETEIVNSLLNIYKQTGYMPDARSGNSNGRTQGGSNAEIVIADALAKGLNIDYNLALEAMLKDATVPPVDDEAEGRGGLKEYNELGYIPYGIARAGNRTVEYAFDDWAIAQVAKHLGKDSLYSQYMKQSERWKNLWRSDYEQDGTKGFIMPRGTQSTSSDFISSPRGGREGVLWQDEVPFGHSKLQNRSFCYSPEISYEGPWYCAWWDCFMYEASSWEYSLSIPHDVPGLIEACGGKEAFECRLDTFFEHGYYNVANEPSFLTPMLYHWIGKPEKSNARIMQIITDNYNDSPMGIPGNDDGGAMSSWLAFHMMGLYPNAGHDYYLVHEPFVNCTITLPNGKLLYINKEKGSERKVVFNGEVLNDWRITHQQLLAGGNLVVYSNDETVDVNAIPSIVPSYKNKERKYLFTYKLHGQTRKFDVDIVEHNDTLTLSYGIQRNLKYWQGSYTMTPKARKHAKSISYLQPIDGQHTTLPDNELFALLSQDIYKQIKKKGKCTWCNTTFRLVASTDNLLHLIDEAEGAEIWVLDNPKLPLIMKMQNNPVEINWEVSET